MFVDIINVMLEELVYYYFELFGFIVFKWIVCVVRNKVNDVCFCEIGLDFLLEVK